MIDLEDLLRGELRARAAAAELAAEAAAANQPAVLAGALDRRIRRLAAAPPLDRIGAERGGGRRRDRAAGDAAVAGAGN